jgi:hypothetical protein
MTEKVPIITVTCFRDLALLDLQAQSISLYLHTDTPVYLIVNEEDPTAWTEYFEANLKHYYSKHNLKVLYRSDFSGEWAQWIPSPINPWAVGWETQQILKLAIAKHLNSVGFLILDSQNFLVRPWDPNAYDFSEGKIPYRTGHFAMPLDIWEQYCQSLDVSLPRPTHNTMSMCTPFFMHTKLVQGLIDSKGGVLGFSRWFKIASRTKSEFILYYIWAEKHQAMDRCHYPVPVIDDWANPYLRDSKNFDNDFNHFVSFIGEHIPHAWSSANHRSWGDMTDKQYAMIKEKLAEFNLTPHFDEYRANYVHIEI